MTTKAKGQRGRLGVVAKARRRVPTYKDGKRTGYDTKQVEFYVTAPANVWKFLDKEDAALATSANPLLGNQVNDYTRDSGMAQITAGDKIAVQGYSGRLRDVPSKGTGRSIRLITGLQIGTNTGRFRSITLNFPTWCSNENISEALGELIPDTKRKMTPGQNEVKPFFITPAGKRYPILNQQEAESDKALDVGNTSASAAEIAKAAKTRNKKKAT
ncbi:hypothetical protein QQ056_09390 [Oscillatoria laete-virens NRMC-F 0139]|nr:hypothetical protein [Oscillatoria laete-virens]MDL5053756.1 hypothetical protein [Oscillatoria laete-virens NRMC-F 0139]